MSETHTIPLGSSKARPAGGAWLRRMRSYSGMVLLVYLSVHLSNHALGLVSLATMEAVRVWFLTVWHHPLGTVLLYGALSLHLCLALWSLYQRRRLRMPGGEAVQLLLGLAIPPLLTTHIVGTRLAHSWFDVDASYTYVVLALWHFKPEFGVLQSLTIIVAWLHGCLGMHYWLRLKPWYARVLPWGYSMALLLPVLAVLGFVQAGREISLLVTETGWLQETLRVAKPPDAAARHSLDMVRTLVPLGLGLALGVTLLARVVRQWAERRQGTVTITYSDGKQVVVPRGFSVLEASRLAHIPHASVCGGRGRCSTCRVRVSALDPVLPGPSAEEQRVLTRVGAAPGVRLACQFRPLHNLTVHPLLPSHVHASAGFAHPNHVSGQEQDIAILFADLRGFTRLAEPKFPYDVVFFLNRYFEAIGSAIAQAGGVANQFTGDGVMALFGVGSDPVQGCRQALQASSAMLRNLATLSQTLATELPTPLQMGIGIHTGPAVVGRMGYADTTYLTAVGDTVHVASRLEGLTKDYQCQMVISERVAQCAGIDVSAYPAHELTVRNRTAPLAIRVIDDVHHVVASMAGQPAVPR